MKRDYNLGWVPLVIIVLGMLLGAFGAYVTRQECHGQCTHDRKCQERCLRANYCPYGEQ